MTYTVKVTKCLQGAESTFRYGTKRYYFEATFTFSNGSIVKKLLGGVPQYLLSPKDPNSKWYIKYAFEEYANIETLEPTSEVIAEAIKDAIEDYENAKKWMAEPTFLYSRFNSYGVCFYHADSNSPTGVRAKGGCSSIALCDLVARELGKNAGTLSPTEDLRSAR